MTSSNTQPHRPQGGTPATPSVLFAPRLAKFGTHSGRAYELLEGTDSFVVIIGVRVVVLVFVLEVNRAIEDVVPRMRREHINVIASRYRDPEYTPIGDVIFDAVVEVQNLLLVCVKVYGESHAGSLA